MKEQTLSELSAALEAQNSQFNHASDPLLIATQVVGRVLGIKISLPPFFKVGSPSLETLEAIAEASGIRVRRVLLTPYWWKQSRSALLGFTATESQPVALLPRGRNYVIFDPATHRRTPMTPELAQNLAPIAYTFYPSLPEGQLEARDFIRFALKGSGRELIQVVLVGMIATFLSLLIPQAFGWIVDYAIPNADRGLLGQIGLGLFAISFGVAMFQLAQNITILRIRTRGISITQAAVWDRLLKLPVSRLRSYTTGELYDRVSSVSQMGDQLQSTTLQLLFSSSLSLLSLIILLIYSPLLASIAVVVITMVLGVTTFTIFALRPQAENQQNLQASTLGLTFQLTKAIPKLRIAFAEERAFNFWMRQYYQQLGFILNQQILRDRVTLLSSLMPTIGLIAIFGFGVPMVQSASPLEPGELSIGRFLAFYMTFGLLISGVVSLSHTLLEGMSVIALWRQVKPLLKIQPEIHAYQSDPGQLLGYLKLDQVSFRYDPNRALVLNRVTLEVQPKKMVGIVGTPGSGKSTLVRLLLGFESPESGAIYYDGQDLSRLNYAAVRRQLGVVLQQGKIYRGTILENISGRTLASMDEVWEAAAVAGLVDEIQRSPMGMHTMIAEGGINLSGGQRQQLLIARALVTQPAVLILDEAMNSLDYQRRTTLMQYLEQLEVTRIIISRDPENLRHADQIYVLDAGRIVQQGSFEALHQQEAGLFQQLIGN
ncbi:MAG: NHLP bacteriocin export ABC transporter permease/ATPase subunit [Microcoleaceae cyanobacterium]